MAASRPARSGSGGDFLNPLADCGIRYSSGFALTADSIVSVRTALAERLSDDDARVAFLRAFRNLNTSSIIASITPCRMSSGGSNLSADSVAKILLTVEVVQQEALEALLNWMATFLKQFDPKHKEYKQRDRLSDSILDVLASVDTIPRPDIVSRALVGILTQAATPPEFQARLLKELPGILPDSEHVALAQQIRPLLKTAPHLLTSVLACLGSLSPTVDSTRELLQEALDALPAAPREHWGALVRFLLELVPCRPAAFAQHLGPVLAAGGGAGGAGMGPVDMPGGAAVDLALVRALKECFVRRGELRETYIEVCKRSDATLLDLWILACLHSAPFHRRATETTFRNLLAAQAQANLPALVSLMERAFAPGYGPALHEVLPSVTALAGVLLCATDLPPTPIQRAGAALYLAAFECAGALPGARYEVVTSLLSGVSGPGVGLVMETIEQLCARHRDEMEPFEPALASLLEYPFRPQHTIRLITALSILAYRQPPPHLTDPDHHQQQQPGSGSGGGGSAVSDLAVVAAKKMAALPHRRQAGVGGAVRLMEEMARARVDAKELIDLFESTLRACSGCPVAQALFFDSLAARLDRRPPETGPEEDQRRSPLFDSPEFARHVADATGGFLRRAVIEEPVDRIVGQEDIPGVPSWIGRQDDGTDGDAAKPPLTSVHLMRTYAASPVDLYLLAAATHLWVPLHGRIAPADAQEDASTLLGASLVLFSHDDAVEAYAKEADHEAATGTSGAPQRPLTYCWLLLGAINWSREMINLFAGPSPDPNLLWRRVACAADLERQLLYWLEHAPTFGTLLARVLDPTGCFGGTAKPPSRAASRADPLAGSTATAAAGKRTEKAKQAIGTTLMWYVRKHMRPLRESAQRALLAQLGSAALLASLPPVSSLHWVIRELCLCTPAPSPPLASTHPTSAPPAQVLYSNPPGWPSATSVATALRHPASAHVLTAPTASLLAALPAGLPPMMMMSMVRPSATAAAPTGPSVAHAHSLARVLSILSPTLHRLYAWRGSHSDFLQAIATADPPDLPDAALADGSDSNRDLGREDLALLGQTNPELAGRRVLICDTFVLLLQLCCRTLMRGWAKPVTPDESGLAAGVSGPLQRAFLEGFCAGSFGERAAGGAVATWAEVPLEELREWTADGMVRCLLKHPGNPAVCMQAPVLGAQIIKLTSLLGPTIIRAAGGGRTGRPQSESAPNTASAVGPESLPDSAASAAAAETAAAPGGAAPPKKSPILPEILLTVDWPKSRLPRSDITSGCTRAVFIGKGASRLAKVERYFLQAFQHRVAWIAGPTVAPQVFRVMTEQLAAWMGTIAADMAPADPAYVLRQATEGARCLNSLAAMACAEKHPRPFVQAVFRGMSEIIHRKGGPPLRGAYPASRPSRVFPSSRLGQAPLLPYPVRLIFHFFKRTIKSRQPRQH
ncbi:hypothetical protein PAPYR_2643 [Paratrimastix pyriformis]|uniref:Uncharacterized protein n=1 Tax=Paratrimastix pyriformis TaxID=342808 RepID=A0ABQ8US62_9EUKA|nr:hypothetical protein PAPYR_2643 [Paratrimastix pyriformis]